MVVDRRVTFVAKITMLTNYEEDEVPGDSPLQLAAGLFSEIAGDILSEEDGEGCEIILCTIENLPTHRDAPQAFNAE
jgi:hypothetical protein